MGIEKITVYNVGFGDSLLLEGEDCNLLVDCGTKESPDNKRDTIEKDIKQRTDTRKELDCVITHFHEDHYSILNVFEETVFDKLYVPNFFSEEDIELQLLILLTCSSRKQIYKFASSVLHLIPKLFTYSFVRDDTIVHFVKRGNLIHQEYPVLWPEIDPKKANKFLDRFFDILAKSELEERGIPDIETDYDRLPHDNVPNTYEIMEKAAKLATKYRELIIPNFEQEEQGHLPGSSVVRYREKQGEFNEIFASIPSLRRLVPHPLDVKKADPKLEKEIKNYQNSCSIVFHDPRKLSRIKYLLLGDVPSDIFSDEIQKDVAANNYKYIKISHHGTRDYYMGNLPACETMIISNGNRKQWEISAKYVIRYPKVAFVCTNNGKCEYYDANCSQQCNPAHPGTVCGISPFIRLPR